MSPGRRSCRKEEKFGGKEANRFDQFVSVFTVEVNRYRPDSSLVCSVGQYSIVSLCVRSNRVGVFTVGHTHTHTHTLDSRKFLFLLHEINYLFVSSQVTFTDLAKTVLYSAYVFYL